LARIDFCGGSYTLETMNADAQRVLNVYPELVESGSGRSKMTLMPTPGLAALLTTLDGPPRGQLEFNGLLFVIAGMKFYQINLTSLSVFGFPTTPMVVSATPLNGATALANDGLPASLAANENQILMTSAGNVYIYYVNAINDSVTGASIPAGTFKQVPASNFTLSSGNAPVKQVVFCDSFFLALIANSQNIQISNVLDGFNWIPGGSIINGVYTGGVSSQIIVSVTPENVVGMAVDHRQVWMLGRKKIVGYVSGDPFNIFAVQPGAFIEQGAIATFAISQLDNSIFWVSGDDKGSGMGFRLNGLTPQRITTHAVELAWQSYAKISDAVSYSWQTIGHTFWRVLFPSANNGNGATWEYDGATGLWHECDFLNAVSGQSMGHPSWNHSFWNGAHIVGDWRSASLYQMDVGLFDDAGTPIRRVRRAPHVSTELEIMRYDRFILDMETGLGPEPPLQGAGTTTLLTLKDANNISWGVTVLDNGNLQMTSGSLGASQTIFLNSGATTWQLGVSITGLLTTTSVAFNAANPSFIPMVSVSGTKAWDLGVTVVGLLTTTANMQVLARDPVVYLRFSDDGGHTWSSVQPRNAGAAGQYKKRVIWWRLGAARIRTFEVSFSDPVPFRLIDAYINAAPGYEPSERLTHQYRKVA